ncbi:hypothetical protein [Massilia sp. HP4]|uniref:hypothetical protein n=1 Tax=Massilia sp. HP4 TaxID=2562316 RepID=UPI001485C26A|nr:hypothetical protein [Massilia sp. HP4]
MKNNICATMLALSLLAPAVHAQDVSNSDARPHARADYTASNWQSLTRDAARPDVKEQAATEPDRPCAQFRISDDMNARAGRIGLSAFMLTNHRNAGETSALQRPAVINRAADQAFAEAP